MDKDFDESLPEVLKSIRTKPLFVMRRTATGPVYSLFEII
jgi:hypothetical protein